MAKVASKDLVFKIGSPLATIGIFDPKITEVADEIDVTDSESTTGREYLAGYENRTISWSRWVDGTTEAEDVGETVDFSWTFGSLAATGSIVILGRDIGAAKEDAHRYDYTGRITGALAIA